MAIGDGKDYSDKDELFIGMDAIEFQAYLNARFSDKNEEARVENEKKANELKEAELKLEREKEMREREEKAREEERVKAEQREKDRIEKQVRDQKEKEEWDKREAEDKIKKEEAEKEKLAKQEKFIAFLKTLGWTEETRNDFLLNYSPTEVKVYKLLGTYKEN